MNAGFFLVDVRILDALGDLAQRRQPRHHKVPDGERVGRAGGVVERHGARGVGGVQQRHGHVDDALRAERARPAELQRGHLPPAPASGAGAHERAHHDAREAEHGDGGVAAGKCSRVSLWGYGLVPTRCWNR